jgi:hypothetical protein
MLFKRLLTVIAATCILFLQVQSCMSAEMLNQQSMQCCNSMPCTPMNKDMGCCKDMVSPKTPNMLPTHHESLQPPVVANFEYSQSMDLAFRTTSPSSEPVVAQQHSPPELYKIHLSFLI